MSRAHLTAPPDARTTKSIEGGPTIDKARKRIPFQFDRILSLRMTMTMTNMSTTNTNTNANADTNTGMNIALPFPFTLFCCDYFPIQKKVKINSQTP